jgi:signal transduction histidine kinase/DNA-binding response OmpR family regulator
MTQSSAVLARPELLPAEVAPPLEVSARHLGAARRRVLDALVRLHGDRWSATAACATLSTALRQDTASPGWRLLWVMPAAGARDIRLWSADLELSIPVRVPKGFAVTVAAVSALARSLVSRSEAELLDEVQSRNAELDAIRRGLEETVGERTAELEAARLEAEAATEAKSLFLANMSHEIRTPMNAIIGLSDIALRGELPSEARRHVSRIHLAGTSLLGIINDILDFSKIEAGRMEFEARPFSVDTMMEGVATVVSHLAHEKGLEFVFHVAPGVPHALVGDSLRIGQILNNLCNNAVKFTEEGVVTLRVAARSTGASRCAVEFTVQDTGIGMTAGQLERLFTPFTQADASTSRRFGGTGLGLTISRHLAEQMGGGIEVRSAPGKGSRFTLTVPLDVAESVPDTPMRRTQQRVLVVDDHEAAREALLVHLQGAVESAEAVGSGAAALELARARQAEGRPFDLCLIDFMMPGMGGVDLARALRSEAVCADDARLILVTAMEGPEVVRARRFFDGNLTKPVLRGALRAVLGQRTHGPNVDDERPDLAGVRVLLVEDNEINREIAVTLLTGQGASVVEAVHGGEACELLAGPLAAERFDVVLLDLQMPVMDGYETARRIRARRELDGLPVLAMTAHAMPEDLARCLALGMDGRVTKPVDPEALFAAVAAARTGRDRGRGPDGSAPKDSLPVLSEAPVAAGGRLVLSASGGLARVGGDEATYARLLRQLVRKWPPAAASALVSGEPATAASALHGLRGVAANLGLDRLADLTGDLEARARCGDAVGASAERLRAELAEAEKAVASWCTAHEAPPAAVEPPVSEGPALADWVGLLLEGDPDAVELLPSVEPALVAACGAALAAEVAELVEDFDFDAAHERITTAVPSLE